MVCTCLYISTGNATYVFLQDVIFARAQRFATEFYCGAKLQELASRNRVKALVEKLARTKKKIQEPSMFTCKSTGHSAAILKPANSKQVTEILKYAGEKNLTILPLMKEKNSAGKAVWNSASSQQLSEILKNAEKGKTGGEGVLHDELVLSVLRTLQLDPGEDEDKKAAIATIQDGRSPSGDLWPGAKAAERALSTTLLVQHRIFEGRPFAHGERPLGGGGAYVVFRSKQEKEKGFEVVIWERIQGFIGPYLKAIADWWEGFKCSQLLGRVICDHAWLGLDEEHYRLNAINVTLDELCEHRRGNNLPRILWKAMLSNMPLGSALFCTLAFVMNRSLLDALRLLLVVFACLRSYPFPANWLWTFLKIYSTGVLVLRTLYDLPVVCAGFQLRQPRFPEAPRLMLEPEDSYQWSTASSLEGTELWIDAAPWSEATKRQPLREESQVWADHLCIWAVLMHQWILQRYGVGRFVVFDAQSQRLWLRKQGDQCPAPSPLSSQEVRLKEENLGTWGSHFREDHKARSHRSSVDASADGRRREGSWTATERVRSPRSAPKPFMLRGRSSRRSRVEDALDLFHAMPRRHLKANVFSYSATISACEKLGHWQQALSLFAAMPAAQVEPDVVTFNTTLSAVEKGAAHWQFASALFEAMPAANVCPDLISFNSAISLCEKFGVWMQALGFWRAMTTQQDGLADPRQICRMDFQHIAADAVTFGALLSAAEKAFQWQRALEIFAAMPASKVEPNLICFNAILSSCENMGMWQEALVLLASLMQMRLAPDFITFNAVLRSCEKQAKWPEALHLCRMTQEAEVADTTAVNATIGTCDKASQWRWAIHLIQVQSSPGQPGWRAQKLKSLSRADLIWTTLEQWRLEGQRLDPRTYTVGISSCGRLAKWPFAVALLASMPKAEVQPNAFSYAAVMAACRRAQDWQVALSLLDEMQVAEVQPNQVCFNTAISCAGRWFMAIHLLEQMPDTLWAKSPGRAEGFNAAMSLCEWHQAMLLFEAMPQAEDVISFNSTISACEKGHEWPTALALFEQMPEMQVQADLITFNSTMSALEKGSQWQETLHFYGHISCERSQQWAAALALYTAMERQEVKADGISFNALMSSFKDAGRWQDAGPGLVEEAKR
eukprot:g29409.t1